MNYIYKIITFLCFSSLLFFSISFISVLWSINTPWNRPEDDRLHIGFPWVYYEQFMVDFPIPNSNWAIEYLVLDVLFCSALCSLIYFFLKKNLKQKDIFD